MFFFFFLHLCTYSQVNFVSINTVIPLSESRWQTLNMVPSDVCPTEDAVKTFIEHLVDPLLPAKSSVQDSPSPSQQKLVARQVFILFTSLCFYNHPTINLWGFFWHFFFMICFIGCFEEILFWHTKDCFHLYFPYSYFLVRLLSCFGCM